MFTTGKFTVYITHLAQLYKFRFRVINIQSKRRKNLEGWYILFHVFMLYLCCVCFISHMCICRCFLGPNQGPAQWPDCNRYTESGFLELLRIFPRDVRKSTQKVTRFGLVLSAYSQIRECVLNNHMVMRDTAIQLPDINKGTLTQW
jgi:hypothetical protein